MFKIYQTESVAYSSFDVHYRLTIVFLNAYTHNSFAVEIVFVAVLLFFSTIDGEELGYRHMYWETKCKYEGLGYKYM